VGMNNFHEISNFDKHGSNPLRYLIVQDIRIFIVSMFWRQSS